MRIINKCQSILEGRKLREGVFQQSLKLVYESTSGFKTAGGWYTIPDNREWHTVRWKILDPQFVNYWGYNFSLVSDGNLYKKYYLQSVTVTKVGE